MDKKPLRPIPFEAMYGFSYAAAAAAAAAAAPSVVGKIGILTHPDPMILLVLFSLILYISTPFMTLLTP